jgi:hypothetical protein
MPASSACSLHSGPIIHVLRSIVLRIRSHRAVPQDDEFAQQLAGQKATSGTAKLPVEAPALAGAALGGVAGGVAGAVVGPLGSLVGAAAGASTGTTIAAVLGAGGVVASNVRAGLCWMMMDACSDPLATFALPCTLPCTAGGKRAPPRARFRHRQGANARGPSQEQLMLFCKQTRLL